MVDRRMSAHAVVRTICSKTGLRMTDLGIRELTSKGKELYNALQRSKHLREPEIFINEYLAWNKSHKCKEIKAQMHKSQYDCVEDEVDSKLEVTDQRFIGHDGMCNGWITEGRYDNKEYSYYTKDPEIGREKLVEYIAICITNDTPINPEELDNYIEHVLSYTEDERGTECLEKLKDLSLSQKRS